MHILGMRNWVIIISVRFSEMQNWVIMIRGSAPLNECKLILSSEWLWASKQQYIYKKKTTFPTTHHTQTSLQLYSEEEYFFEIAEAVFVGWFSFEYVVRLDILTFEKKVISWPWAKDVISTMLIIIIFIFQVHRSPTQIKVRNEWVWSQI